MNQTFTCPQCKTVISQDESCVLDTVEDGSIEICPDCCMSYQDRGDGIYTRNYA